MIYLDWAATAPPDPEVVGLMAEALTEFYGNPSSPHPPGKKSRAALDDARSRCATVLNCQPQQLAFTSGGTESNSIALLSRLLTPTPGTILFSGLEHRSVAEPIRMLGSHGWKIKELDPEPDGRVTPKKLAAALGRTPDARLVAVMGVNNEIGAVQPIREMASLVRSIRGGNGRKIHFHADLVQAVGKIPIDLSQLDVDTASFSAHKFRGPRGMGLLYHRSSQLEVLLKGGGQEFGIRPGTENVAGAVAMALALERHGKPNESVRKNGTWLMNKIQKNSNAVLIPAQRVREDVSASHYVPGIIAVAFPPIPGEVLARVMAESGYALSTGSACNNNTKGRYPKSMVALGVAKEVAMGMIRISIGSTTTREELETFFAALEFHVDRLGQVNP